MAEGSVSSDTTLEKPSPLLTSLGKTLLLQSFTVLGTNACIEGVLEDVAGLVAHRLQLGLNVGRWVLEVLPEDLKWHLFCPDQPCHIQCVILHLNPVFNALVLVKTAGDHSCKSLTFTDGFRRLAGMCFFQRGEMKMKIRGAGRVGTGQR